MRRNVVDYFISNFIAKLLKVDRTVGIFKSYVIFDIIYLIL